MRLALMSDIHANIQALDACLAHARARGVRQFAFLGDLVGYGGDPVAVLAQVQTLVAHGALVLKGNHDALAVHPPALARTLGDSTAAWTHAQLDDAQRGFLQQLPVAVQHESCLLVHASADEPERWRYVQDDAAAAASLDAAGSASHVFVGHVHCQTLYGRCQQTRLGRYMITPGVAVPVPTSRQWQITIGSVGQPRDGDSRAMYAVFDTDRFELSFERVEYDHAGAAAAIRHAGLPAFFADRLAQGR